MSKKRKSSRVVREPIQVYLTPEERELLDQTAARTSLSRAEVLRRGLRKFARGELSGAASPMLQFTRGLAGKGWPSSIARDHDRYLADAFKQKK